MLVQYDCFLPQLSQGFGSTYLSFAKIEYELQQSVDKHSKKLIASNIELFLNYCNRFYDRPFIPREHVNQGIIEKFEEKLNDYFASDKPQRFGLPSVAYFADVLHLSANYFGDLIKKETGKSAKEYIQFEQLLLAGDLPQMLHEYYEKEMGKQNDIYKILRLMIIESLVQNGVENYSTIKKDAALIYGFQKIFLFKCLEQAGLLRDKPSSKIPFELNAYRSIQNKLSLINTEFNPNKINDCSYVFGGYCSISLRLIEAVVKNGWRDINDALKKLPGATYYPNNEKEILRTTLAKKEKNFIFLIFIGGITYAEIEGIRFLNQINKDFKFIIITTSIINPKKIFDSLEPEIASSLKMKEAYENYIAGKKKK